MHVYLSVVIRKGLTTKPLFYLDRGFCKDMPVADGFYLFGTSGGTTDS